MGWLWPSSKDITALEASRSKKAVLAAKEKNEKAATNLVSAASKACDIVSKRFEQ